MNTYFPQIQNPIAYEGPKSCFTMKPSKLLPVLFLAMLAIPPAVDAAESSPVAKVAPAGDRKALTVSLAGKWRFALDPKGVGVEQRWFAKDLTDAIQLPGNIESQGYGDEITGKTPWTSWEPEGVASPQQVTLA